ncbi:MAG: TPP-dependent 2-oxoacid decarboxylase [Crocinitomix sp.]|jgi:TPP-dependent 2-oxoacid decarboxylase
MKQVPGQIRVADYLAIRLEQLGIKKMFGVPGDHLGPFISAMEESTAIKWNGGTNEINIGYAADGYARENGVSAVGVTYGVGALSLINTISGAFVEKVPIVVINASPTYEQILNFRNVGLLTSHMSTNELSNINAYSQVTVDTQKITNSALAPQQIDCALSACISLKQPVYLEICQNVFTEYCDAPSTELEVLLPVGNADQTAGAVTAVIDLIKSFGSPIFWVGNEVSREGLQDAFLDLVNETHIPFCSTIMAKTVVGEDNEHFHGIYNGKASDPDVWHIFKNVANCRIGIGAWSTSKNLGGTQNTGADWSMAARKGVSVGHQYFPNVMLRDFIPQLHAAILDNLSDIKLEEDLYLSSNQDVKKVKSLSKGDPRPDLFQNRAAFFKQAALHKSVDKTALKLTYDNVFVTVNNYLQEKERYKTHFVVADAGFSLLGAQTLRMKRRKTFFSQASWLSIGYSVGAVVGLQLAKEGKDEQAMVFVGDGAFQETAQAVSDLTRTKSRNIVFVFNNEDFYGIEQMLVNACFYREEMEADVYNKLHPWNYEKLAAVFHQEETPCHGITIQTIGELKQVLRDRETEDNPIHNGTLLIRVLLDRLDYPEAIKYKVDEKEGEC